MSVAVSHLSESHTGTTGNTSGSSFTWNHVTTGDQSIVIFVVTLANATQVSGNVTANSVAATPITTAITDTSEPGTVTAYFLDNVSQSASCPLVVNRTGSAEMYACAISFTAATHTGAWMDTVYTTGTISSMASPSAQSIDDGSPGSNSVVVGACYYGANNPAAPQDANTTTSTSIGIDFGIHTFQACYETTPTTGARTRGFASGSNDDLAEILFAVREFLDITVDASSGSATGSGGDATATVPAGPLTVTASGGSATATGGQIAAARTIVAATGTAAASGGTARIAIQIVVAVGAATATGGTATAASAGPVAISAVGGSATASGGIVALSRAVNASGGTASGAGGSVRIATQVSVGTGSATAAGGTAGIGRTLDVASGSATAAGGTVAQTTSGGASVTASGGSATATGSALALAVRYTLMPGAATGAGGQATTTVQSGFVASGGNATTAGGSVWLAFRYGLSTGVATTTGGQVVAFSAVIVDTHPPLGGIVNTETLGGVFDDATIGGAVTVSVHGGDSGNQTGGMPIISYKGATLNSNTTGGLVQISARGGEVQVPVVSGTIE